MVFSMDYSPPEAICPSMWPHGPALLPEILLLHEHIHLLQLKLSAGCSVVLHGPQESRVLHYGLPCGLCRILQFSTLRICRVSHICHFSLSWQLPHSTFYHALNTLSWGSALVSTVSIMEPPLTGCAQTRERPLSLLTEASSKAPCYQNSAT